MILTSLNILNYKNIREASLGFSDKLNCFVGLNGQGKTNVLDAIYLLSFTKSAYNATDSLNITHDEDMALVQGVYRGEVTDNSEQITDNVADPTTSQTVSCGLRRGQKKQLRWGKADYKRLIDHIGRIPLVMVSPRDSQLIEEGSDERRRFLDSVISQTDKTYIEYLTQYTALLKQRNALLKQYADTVEVPWDLFEVLEMQMAPLAQYIYEARERFVAGFVPVFQEVYQELSGGAEQVSLRYVSQLQDRDLGEAYIRTRARDIILGWTSQGVHKDDVEMRLGDYPLKQVASQGQQKTYLLAMKLAQAVCLSQKSQVESQKPILLLDDIFDKLDSERVERIVRLVQSERFGQIFITDTDRQHLTDILRPSPEARIFYVNNGQITDSK